MGELELFPDEGSQGSRSPARGPLAARMRPRSVEEIQGQDQLLGEGKPIRRMLEGGELRSMILWGPPGSGKTTLARLLADRSDAHFEAFSAVTEGVARVRELIAQAKERLRATGRQTILFCDEIHRFNKAQQDAFLPHVEAGTVVLIGATTENPSFEVVRPLLSRAPVFVLDPLGIPDLVAILERALATPGRGLGDADATADEGVLEWIAEQSDGDARRALGAIEAAVDAVGPDGTLTPEVAAQALQHRYAVYDKSGEEHYNLISALHKAVRGSDPDGALYWLARMIQGGEDPLYIARRVVRMASEDIGLADPRGLSVAMAARDAYHFLGPPEGELAVAEAVVYLATAPKSNRLYEAWSRARNAARDTSSAPVPLHIRNAPTELMKDLGYGEGYRYDPAEEEGVAAQEYLPEGLEDARFYVPGDYGFERTIEKRLEWWRQRKAAAAERARPEDARGGGDADADPGESSAPGGDDQRPERTPS